ncbi:ATP-dependent DNA helicase RecG [bacterium A37T11]|nr:ATP-dependent DNA helicase RecG [bacterium A37T11]
MAEYTIKTPIEYLKGVGTQRAELLKKELGVFTLGDLLHYYPFRYIDRTKIFKIRDLTAEMPAVQVIGMLKKLEIFGEKKSRRLVGQFTDDTASIELVWFQGVRWLEEHLKVNTVYLLFGKPNFFNNQLSITHPELEVYDRSANSTGNIHLQPVYGSTEKLKRLSLDTKGIQRLQASTFELLYPTLTDDLPEYLRVKYGLISLPEALKGIHFPTDKVSLELSRTRLKFNELFFIQLKLLRTKFVNSRRFEGLKFVKVGQKFNDFFLTKLPFPLTNAQKRVIREIRVDTNTGAQMNRLLQGDVGSGKTIVALMSMLLAVDNGYQACLMAPTEILARQHYQGLKGLTGEGFVQLSILTGSTPKRERKHIHAALENGSLHLLVGTHALIEDVVKFKNLGLVVIDEQHRFGVEQRSKLWKKNSIPPHMLVMTATPIPRTLAMTMYGDLDVSVIDELPAGRKPIKTLHMTESSRLRMFGFMRYEIAKGRQVYVVYPLIKESEKLDLLYLEAGIEHLAREFPLPEYRISVVHGKMKPKDKDFEMQRFVKGETQILVATTVIEVGVNVPNASVMIIENAERFGLSQLHQLRGRVGRGAEQSFCILMSGNKISKQSRQRLETMVRTNDGFEIAEADLELRGPGDLSGTQQSGLLELKLADLITDQLLLQQVREGIIRIFTDDPELARPENALLKAYLMHQQPGISWDKIS